MRTLVAVADRGRFKAFELIEGQAGRGGHLELLETTSRDEIRTKLSEQLSDSAGRFPRESAPPGLGGVGMSVGERHELEHEHERRAVAAIAAELAGLLEDDAFGACWLAVAQPIHRMLLDSLAPAARAKVRKLLPLDLTKAEPEDVLRRFEAP